MTTAVEFVPSRPITFDDVPEYITEDFVRETGACNDGLRKMRETFGPDYSVRRTRENMRRILKAAGWIEHLVRHPNLTWLQDDYYRWINSATILQRARWVIDNLSIPDDSPELVLEDLPPDWRRG